MSTLFTPHEYKTITAALDSYKKEIEAKKNMYARKTKPAGFLVFYVLFFLGNAWGVISQRPWGDKFHWLEIPTAAIMGLLIATLFILFDKRNKKAALESEIKLAELKR